MKSTLIKTALVLLTLIIFSCSKDGGSTPNQPPEAFNLIGVTNEAIEVGLFPTFSWNDAIDPENDLITYSLVLDTEEEPTMLIESDINTTSVTLTNKLKLLTTYYWKILATDTSGNVTESDIYSFTTRNIGFSSSPLVENAAFPARGNHSTAIFNDNLYVINGENGLQNLNDIWTSSNGSDWELNNNTVAFAARFSQTSVVFNDKLWVIAGVTSSGEVNDVWSSSNGANWSLENNNAGFSPRSLHASVVFNNKIWVIGGGYPLTNDVWSSSDGTNWTLATPSAEFSTRGQHSCVVFDDKIWVIGGFVDFEILNDVWSSSDGVNWVQSTNNAPFSTADWAKCIVLDDKLWVIGGGSVNGTTSLWSSTDGNNWILAIENLPFSFRIGYSATVFNDKIYVIGGIDSSGAFNDVWVFE